MPETLNWGIEYPAPEVAPNIPLAMQNLAESVESAMDRKQSGKVSFPVIAMNASSSVYVPFTPGRFTKPPVVIATAGSGRLTLAVSNITADGFTLGADNFSNNTASASVAGWLALPSDN